MVTGWGWGGRGRTQQKCQDAAEGLVGKIRHLTEVLRTRGRQNSSAGGVSLECWARSQWYEMTVTTWRNAGPPDAAREDHGCLCVETVYFTGLGFGKDLTLARAGGVMCLLGWEEGLSLGSALDLC